MRETIAGLLEQALEALTADGTVPAEHGVAVHVERARQREHGDFASNLAMNLARAARRKPRELAERIVAALPASSAVTRVEIAGPGFINFFVSADALRAVVRDVLAAGARYGHGSWGGGERVLVEFVSANPTGPLHVGHGRGAAYGDTLARVLRAAGHEVEAEYYVNDAGRQMNILALSVWLRYLERLGERFAFPENLYRGDYVREMAGVLEAEDGDRWRRPSSGILGDDLPDEGEARSDALVERMRAALGEEGFARVHALGVQLQLDDIRDDLAAFGVRFQRWFSEQSLVDSGALDHALEILRATDWYYEKDGAWWLRSTAFGDEKDRVVVRENGAPTYLATDIAYHLDKCERGYHRLINIWGADHHGYISRVKAALAALGRDPDILTVLLVQFAVLYRHGEKVSMSTRGGEFVTLRELREETGTDAARFFYALRRSDQHLDFDIDLARSRSNDNPVYYVQYAHARVCSVFAQLAGRGIDPVDTAAADLDALAEEHEWALLRTLSRFPETVESAARDCEPHQIAYYLRELANDFHTYYNAHPFLTAEARIRNARLALIDATRRVIANGLDLLGVSAPSEM